MQYVSNTLLTQPYMDVRVSTVVVGPTSVQIAPADSSRVELIFALFGIGLQVNILPIPDITFDRGIPLIGDSEPLHYYYARDGVIVCRTWSAIAGFAGGTVTVIELTYRPPLSKRRRVADRKNGDQDGQ